MFIYTKEFSKLWSEIFGTYENLRELEDFLLENPKAGNVIKGTNGLRKLRWKTEGKGKRGGLRILYVDFENYNILFFISLIKKNDKENISSMEQNIMNNLIFELERSLKVYYT
ncbi:MAG: type II toxin-antitoxin system RelE/ParE family toxin [Ignavibacteria bacterium]|nr:type II toxin-antitoxin system RelE/ParE family toxin [Ignavibacteria bacterium]